MNFILIWATAVQQQDPWSSGRVNDFEEGREKYIKVKTFVE